MATKKTAGLTAKTMKASIQEMAADLGMPPIKFEADADLQLFWRGPPLKVSELRALPNGSVVYVTYRQHGEEGFRMNGAMWISREPDAEDWWVEDGSSFAGEFRPGKDLGADDDCYDDCYGEGQMHLYQAEAITATEKKNRLSAQKKLLQLLEDIQKGGPEARKALAYFKRPRGPRASKR